MVDSLLTATALKEILFAAKLCIETKKDECWAEEGRLGFPAALLLLTYIDSAGFLAFIKGTKEDKGENTPFGLAYEKYIDSSLPNLSKSNKREIKEILCNKYRNYLLHQATIPDGTSLSVDQSIEIITKNEDGHTLHLVALYKNCLEFYNSNINLFIQKSDRGRIGTL